MIRRCAAVRDTTAEDVRVADLLSPAYGPLALEPVASFEWLCSWANLGGTKRLGLPHRRGPCAHRLPHALSSPVNAAGHVLCSSHVIRSTTTGVLQAPEFFSAPSLYSGAARCSMTPSARRSRQNRGET